jgi:molybdopterin-containing oxidoreductase family iron-sulfur binding subunit
MNRREFLKVTGLGASASLVGGCLAGDTVSGTGRLAMAIDVDACARQRGCRVCIDACHARHNVPVFSDPARAVEWLSKETFAATFPEVVNEWTPAPTREQRVLVLCNHCGSPPCTRVCPTGATWRRDDGIVMMDEHRCIGCRYCMVACPYGARSFNWSDPRLGLARVDPHFPTRTIGVVEKCTFCAERLRAGLPPACVEAARQHACGALAFGHLDDRESALVRALRDRTVLRRRPALGTDPHVYYLL